MTLSLRTGNNAVLFEIELFKQDFNEGAGEFVELSTAMNVFNYSYWLLNEFRKYDQDKVINAFDELNELRGWLWEDYFSGKKNTADEFQNVENEIKKRLRLEAKKFDLMMVQD